MKSIWESLPPLTPAFTGLGFGGGWDDDEDPCLFLTEEDIEEMRQRDLKAIEEFVNGKEASNN